MNQQIAVLMNKNYEITSMDHIFYVCIYEKSDTWKAVKEYHLLPPIPETAEIKGMISQLVNQLGECKIVVGKTITGMIYHILDKNGFTMCESENLSDTVLDEIVEDFFKTADEEKEQKINNMQRKQEVEHRNQQIQQMKKSPIPVDDLGNYFLDMIELQKVYPEISTKKALLPFLCNELFLSLKIHCNHVMPWLDGFIADKNLEYTVTKVEQGVNILLNHKVCSTSL